MTEETDKTIPPISTKTAFGQIESKGNLLHVQVNKAGKYISFAGPNALLVTATFVNDEHLVDVVQDGRTIIIDAPAFEAFERKMPAGRDRCRASAAPFMRAEPPLAFQGSARRPVVIPRIIGRSRASFVAGQPRGHRIGLDKRTTSLLTRVRCEL